MKKTGILMLGGLLLAATRAQAILDAGLFGGYTTVSMAAVNEQLDKIDEAEQNAGHATTLTKFSNGYYVGAEAGLTVMPFLKAGPRVEYIRASASSTDEPPLSTKISNTYDADLIPLMVGLSLDMGLPGTNLNVKGGVYGGYGMATFKTSSTNNGSTTTDTLTGCNFVGELNAQLLLKLIPSMHVGLDLGYRFGDIVEMKDKAGKVQTDSNSKALHFDYSGVNIGVAAVLMF